SSFGDALPALESAPTLCPDVAIVDIQLGGGVNGLELGLRLREPLPELGVVLLSNHLDPALLTAIPDDEMRGWGYLLKRSVRDLATLERAVEGVFSGLVVLDPRLTHLSPPPAQGDLSRLSPHQLQVLELLAQGFSNAAIAQQLGATTKSVENQVSAIYRELDIDGTDRSTHPRVLAVLRYLHAVSA
ncbi:MAG TPA: response regulator transcription factor, partial [Limnochordia bacterium]